MIYECPQCRRPQKAGQTVCPQCRAEFDGPVPADAVVLEAMPAEAIPVEAMPAETMPAEVSAAVSDTPDAPDASPIAAEPTAEAEPTLEAAPATAPAGPEPYLTPPSHVPPPYTPPVSTVTQTDFAPPAPPLGKLTRVLLVAFPLIFILVLGGVYLAGTLDTGADTVPITLPAVAAAAPLLPAPATSVAPVTLEGGSNTNDGTDPHVKLLAGRWVSKSNDFYVFNPDGTGSRGSALTPSAEQPFLWGLVQNRLMLYGGKNETLRFNAGPDNNTVFLAPQTGHYVQYSRAKSDIGQSQ